MTITLYVLLSSVTGHAYVGITKDLSRRIKEHADGKSKFTKAYRPWTLVYTETFPDYMSARKMEKYYKSGIGKERLKEKLSALRNSE